MKFSDFPVSREQVEKLRELCPPNSYIVLDQEQLPVTLPASLASKSFQKVMVMGSGAGMQEFYMINVLRIDMKAAAVDQEPLAIGYNKGKVSAGFIHHGNWTGRTVSPPAGFMVAMIGSGIMEHYPYSGLPSKEKGDLSELTPESQKQAFWNSVKLLHTGNT